VAAAVRSLAVSGLSAPGGFEAAAAGPAWGWTRRDGAVKVGLSTSECSKGLGLCASSVLCVTLSPEAVDASAGFVARGTARWVGAEDTFPDR
jgi:hypothetical protein